VNVFKEQIQLFKEFLMMAAPDKGQQGDIDYLLALGEILTLVAYGQLIIESRKFMPVEEDLLEEIFDFMVRDFSKYALNIYLKPSNSATQMELILKIVKAPVPNAARFEKIWKEHVFALKGTYKMRDQNF
jgi:acyl-CoA dehydrogenase